MAELILHHYDTSPFSEKIRKIFAHKHLAWHAVEQPTIMPKPQLIPLTGGYRRIPVLQIGADVYCDTQLIARTLERLHPEPTIYPAGSEGTCHVWNLWADRLVFFTTTSILFALIGDNVPKEFIDDRTKMMPGRANFAEIPKLAPHAKEQCRGYAQLMATQLADGRPFLLGSQFSLADAACYHPVWFLRNFPPAAVVFDEFARLIEWAERIKAMGHGRRSDMSPADALRIAQESAPTTTTASDAQEPNGVKPGDRVTVTPDDYGFDPVAGEVVASSIHEIAIRRQAPEVGEVVVHFPRIGFRVAQQ
jgi:glutathione S-transferase